MKIVKGDLIQMVKENKFDIFAHGCNCRRTMGAGIALQMAKEFPWLYEADRSSPYQPLPGSFTYDYHALDVPNGGKVLGMNWYTQFMPGANFNLAYLQSIVEFMRHDIWDTSILALLDTPGRLEIGVPLIGCGIGGGDPRQVMGVLASLEAEERYNVTLVLWDKRAGVAPVKQDKAKEQKELVHG